MKNTKDTKGCIFVSLVAFVADPLHGARMATCPECEFDEIDTEDFEEGDTLSCPECGKSLVMVGADELEVADDDDEDLDDDDLDEEEEGDEDDEDLDDEDDEVEDEEDFDE
jgi:uncharacterized Zn finger protein (UPF0148 family)